VDYAIGLVKELKEAEKAALRGRVHESNKCIESAQEMITTLVESGCLTKSVASPITDDMSEAHSEMDGKKKAGMLWGIVGNIHYDLATDVADFCQSEGR
jgi:hypothetical protein